MPPYVRSVDKDGFPIPPSYSEPSGRDDFYTRPNQENPAPSPKRRMHWKIWIAVVVVVIVLAPETYRLGRQGIARWLFDRAEQKMDDQDYASAETDLSWAITWQDDNPELYLARAECREQQQQLDGSLDDLTEVVLLLPAVPDGYLERAWIYSRKGEHRQAIDDANRGVTLISGREDGALNRRAYIRAIAGIELKEGLDDVQRAMNINPDEPAYLDTRGYLQHLLGDQAKAKSDLTQAIKITEQRREQTLIRARRFAPTRVARLNRLFDNDLAVMHQHLGLVEQKLGNKERASILFAQAKQMGYDPNTSVR